MLLEKRQVRAILYYDFKNGVVVSVAVRRINTIFGEGTITLGTAKRWYHRFRSGNESLEDGVISGRKSGVDNTLLRELVESDPTKTTRDLAQVFNVNQTTVIRHLKQIGMTKKEGRWMSEEPTDFLINLSTQPEDNFQQISNLFSKP